MEIRLDIYNRHGDFLGYLPDELVAVGEYEDYPLQLKVSPDQGDDEITLAVREQRLPRRGDYFQLGQNNHERGRRGVIPIRVYYKNELAAVYHLAVSANRFSEEHYHYLIRDLKRVLVSLVASDETSVYGDEYELELQLIDSFDRQLQEISHFFGQLRQGLALVEQAPQRTINKVYHLQPHDRPGRQDAQTVRWQAMHGAVHQGRMQIFTNVESYDVYENQFIIYLLKRLQHYLIDLPDRFAHVIQQKISDIERRIDDWEHYYEIGDNKADAEERRQFKGKQLISLRRTLDRLITIQQEKTGHYKDKVEEFLAQIRHMRQRLFLEKVTSKPTFTLKPTLVLLRDPAYNPIYEGYRKLQQRLRLNELEHLDNLLAPFPRERTSKLFEYWTVIQIYVELKRMGFEDAPGSQGIWSILDKNSFRLRSGGCLPLRGRPGLYRFGGRALEAHLYYEHRFGPDGDFFPDMYIAFTLNTTRILILDAKYRDYDSSPEAYQRDLFDTAYHKYKQLRRRSGETDEWLAVEGVEEIRSQIYAAFIIHSHADHDRFVDYGSAGQANQFGAIPLVPAETAIDSGHLQRLLRMFMRMHLRIFNICWSEKHQEPVKVEFTKSSKLWSKSWEGKYHCPVCENSWWVNHCGHWCEGQAVNVPKITFSDPVDNFFEMDEAGRKMGGNVLLKCSTCNKSYYRDYG